MNRRRKKQGSALIWSIILFVMVTVIATGILFVASQDTIETVNQENRMQAYYISLSGIEIGYGALMAPKGAGKYIDTFDAAKVDVSYTQEIKDGITKVGDVVITIGNVTLDGKRWIQVTSVGTLVGKNAMSTNRMRIDPTNYANIIRDAGH